jgi:hypothetical protein
MSFSWQFRGLVWVEVVYLLNMVLNQLEVHLFYEELALLLVNFKQEQEQAAMFNNKSVEHVAEELLAEQIGYELDIHDLSVVAATEIDN